MKKLYLKLLALLTFVMAMHSAAAEPVWIDVRTIEEHAADHIAGDTNIPLAELDAAQLLQTYAKDAEIMLYCRSGARSGQAKELLEAAGFTNVSNAGGITEVRKLRELAADNVSTATPATAR